MVRKCEAEPGESLVDVIAVGKVPLLPPCHPPDQGDAGVGEIECQRRSHGFRGKPCPQANDGEHRQSGSEEVAAGVAQEQAGLRTL